MGLPMFVEPKAPEAKTKTDPTAPARSTIRRAHSIRYSRARLSATPPGRSSTARVSSRNSRWPPVQSGVDPLRFVSFDQPPSPRPEESGAHRDSAVRARDADEARTQASNRRRQESNRALLRDALSYELPTNVLGEPDPDSALDASLPVVPEVQHEFDGMPPLRRMGRRSVAGMRPRAAFPDPSSRSHRTAVDGLGDRERSLSPEDSWEPLLTTIPPDHRLPSNDSSFTSATASASASASASSLASNPTSQSTPITNPSEEQEISHACDPWDTDSDYTDSGTEDDLDDDELGDADDGIDGGMLTYGPAPVPGIPMGDPREDLRMDTSGLPRHLPMPPHHHHHHFHHHHSPHPYSRPHHHHHHHHDHDHLHDHHHSHSHPLNRPHIHLPNPEHFYPTIPAGPHPPHPHHHSAQNLRLPAPPDTLPPLAPGAGLGDDDHDDSDDHDEHDDDAAARREREREHDLARAEEDQLIINYLTGETHDMQRILAWLARRDEIPEAWWAEAGLSRRDIELPQTRTASPPERSAERPAERPAERL